MNKKLRILFAYHNSVLKYQDKLDDEIILASEWWDRLGVKTEIIRRDFIDELKFRDYANGAFKSISMECQKEIAGKIENPGEFHIIYFLYAPFVQGTAGHFTTFPWVKSNGSVIVCIPLQEADAIRTDKYLWRVLVHESIHAFFGLLNLNANSKLVDVLDTSVNLFVQQHPNCSEAEALALMSGGLATLTDGIFNTWIKPHLDVLYNEPIEFQQASLMKTLIGLLTTLLGFLKPKTSKTQSVIERLGEAMAVFEGFYLVGSIAQRNHNPTNLIYSPYRAGTKDGFAYFNTDGEGWDATQYQLQLIFDGQSKYYQPTMSIMAFISVWASTSPYIEKLNYAKFIANRFGCSIDTSLNNLK